MLDIQEPLVSSRRAFAASLIALLVVFGVWLYVSAGWNPDVRLAGIFVHDVVALALFGLRLRELRMSRAWLLLALLPIIGWLLALVLVLRKRPAAARYSAL